MSFYQENMDKVCSLQLLTSVRRLVLNLTQQHDESREFVQFFHKQLGAILQVRTRHGAFSHSRLLKLSPNRLLHSGHSHKV